ncbi:hypothetical protein F5884DRAFT_686002, partial [Xylogone sp. PMI_703]
FTTLPVVKPPFGYHCLLSPATGARVWPCAVSFGGARDAFMGKCNKKSATEILDYFYENVGSFTSTTDAQQGDLIKLRISYMNNIFVCLRVVLHNFHPEVINARQHAVAAGKILYLGISDTTA